MPEGRDPNPMPEPRDSRDEATPERSPEPRRIITRRRFVAGAGASVIGFGLYANQIARHEIETNHVTLSIRNLPSAFDGFRIIQISDLHLDEYTEEYFLRRIVAHVNAIQADLVLVTGDFVSDAPKSNAFSLAAAVRCGEILHGLTCPLRYGCLGNHDVRVGSRRVIERIQPSGLIVLVNRFVPIERNGQQLWLCAMDDPGQGHPDMKRAVPGHSEAPVILMGHEPDFAADLVRRNPASPVDVLLSGHSHGGQIRLPGGIPLTLPPGAYTFYEGIYHIGQTQLYVNRGIGTVGVPFRLNCPPEITIFTLKERA
jgi:predicted MPP superfamily phosphohydrolase